MFNKPSPCINCMSYNYLRLLHLLKCTHGLVKWNKLKEKTLFCLSGSPYVCEFILRAGKKKTLSNNFCFIKFCFLSQTLKPNVFFNTLWAASEPERMFTCSYLNEMPKKKLSQYYVCTKGHQRYYGIVILTYMYLLDNTEGQVLCE